MRLSTTSSNRSSSATRFEFSSDVWIRKTRSMYAFFFRYCTLFSKRNMFARFTTIIRFATLHEQRESQAPRQMVDKEAQMEDRSEAYENLQQQLNTMLSALKVETATVRELERRLQAGRAAAGAQNDEMKTELESIIGGLQQYLQVIFITTTTTTIIIQYYIFSAKCNTIYGGSSTHQKLIKW